MITLTKTELELPPEDFGGWLLGRGPGIADHSDGEFALMYYDGDWWNEDGTELCNNAPQEWCVAEQLLPLLTRTDSPAEDLNPLLRWILGWHSRPAAISGNTGGHFAIMLHLEDGWRNQGGIFLSSPPERWAYLDDILTPKSND